MVYLNQSFAALRLNYSQGGKEREREKKKRKEKKKGKHVVFPELPVPQSMIGSRRGIYAIGSFIELFDKVVHWAVLQSLCHTIELQRVVVLWSYGGQRLRQLLTVGQAKHPGCTRYRARAGCCCASCRCDQGKSLV